MENSQDSSIFEFNFDEESKSNLSGIAQWTNINAIVGFIGIAVSIVSFVAGFMKLGSYGGSSAVAGAGILSLFISAIVSLVLNITLINAAVNIRRGIESSSQEYFTTGVTKLASYFKILGILTIIVMIFVVLALLVAIMGNSGTGF